MKRKKCKSEVISLSISGSLAELPQSPAFFEFAARALQDPGVDVLVLRQALLYFAIHHDQRGSQWGNHFADHDDANMRIISLYVAASLKDPHALQPIITLLHEQPRHTARYALLLSLADLTDQAEFKKLTGDQPKDKEYESVFHRIPAPP